MILTTLGDLAVFWLYVTLICSFLHYITLSITSDSTHGSFQKQSCQIITRLVKKPVLLTNHLVGTSKTNITTKK